MAKRISIRDSDSVAFLAGRGENFYAGGKFYDVHNFRGMANPRLGDVSFGQLPHHYRVGLTTALIERRVTYIIHSYLTPIAWKVDGEWVKVTEKFSISTTAHQSALYRL